MFYNVIWRSLSHFKINRIVRVLLFSDFVVWSAVNLVAPVFAIFVADRVPGGSLEAVGFSVMIYLIAKSLFEIPIGVLIDRTRTERDDLYVALIGTVVIGLSYLSYQFVENIWQLYGIQVILGLGTACAFPGWYSIFGRHMDKTKQAFQWSLHDVALGVGTAITAAVGAFLIDRFGFPLVFNISGILIIVGACLLFLIRKRVYQI